MKLYSTRNTANQVTLKQAVMQGLPDDNGLFMPTEIPVLPAAFFAELEQKSFREIGLTVCRALLQGAIPDPDLETIVTRALTFPAPTVELVPNVHILELFHGPSLAFKDFGARFMAQLMAYFNRGEDRELTILVATSGDTGGAVAAGFFDTPGIRVVILYPEGKVSPLQEKQLTTLGRNIIALRINGTFDDCQALVKSAFLDPELQQRLRLSSANSINIARLIPQSFYYFEACKQVKPQGRPLVFSVPSGNFGNLTAGLIAHRMGLPVHRFIAATNSNDVVPEYLEKGIFRPRPSQRTISNAMDVGNPSNFARLLDLFQGSDERSTWNNMKDLISGYRFTDAETRAGIQEIKDRYGYVIDPHGAVGYLALKAYQQEHPDHLGIVLETAHPAKFIEEVEAILGEKVEIPERLAKLAHLPSHAVPLNPDYAEFKSWLMDH